jgi:hypothetical protein
MSTTRHVVPVNAAMGVRHVPSRYCECDPQQAVDINQPALVTFVHRIPPSTPDEPSGRVAGRHSGAPIPTKYEHRMTEHPDPEIRRRANQSMNDVIRRAAGRGAPVDEEPDPEPTGDDPADRFISRAGDGVITRQPLDDHPERPHDQINNWIRNVGARRHQRRRQATNMRGTAR